MPHYKEVNARCLVGLALSQNIIICIFIVVVVALVTTEPLAAGLLDLDQVDEQRKKIKRHIALRRDEKE